MRLKNKSYLKKMNKQTIERHVREVYEELLELDEGNVANYIPSLGKVNASLYAVSVATVNGDLMHFGDSDIQFCLQSCSKPLNYCIARELNDEELVGKHVGYEPSGREFNAHVLNSKGIPHNPMINAGAIMVSSLIKPNEEPATRFETITEYYRSMCGSIGAINFDNSVYLSEKHHADRNRSLAYFMRESRAFPPKTDIEETLNLYFQCCSVTVNAKQVSIMASTLANQGVCPASGEKVFEEDTVRDCLALMYMCGMYDFSGQFAFEVGLPAKSGVSGCLLIVVPNVMGICVWSPRLDSCGNTVRGVEFSRRLQKRLQLHMFHNMTRVASDAFPTDPEMQAQLIISAASSGNVEKLKKFEGRVSFDVRDYDGRTPIHLASAEGHLEIVQYLIEMGVHANRKDRWGNTALSEAKGGNNNENYRAIIDILSDQNDRSSESSESSKNLQDISLID